MGNIVPLLLKGRDICCNACFVLLMCPTCSCASLVNWPGDSLGTLNRSISGSVEIISIGLAMSVPFRVANRTSVHSIISHFQDDFKCLSAREQFHLTKLFLLRFLR